MAKDYMCKECENNKNGWCTERKIQGLKNIVSCNVKNNGGTQVVKEVSKEIHKEDKDKTLSYKTLGSREMFYYVQSQILAIEQGEYEDKWKALKGAMLGLEQKLQIDEHIFGIAIDYILDGDMINESKYISQYWKDNM